MQHTENGHGIVRLLIDKDVAAVDHEFACAADTAKPSDAGMGHERSCALREEAIEGDRRLRVITFDVIVDGFSVPERLRRPEQMPHSVPPSRRRVASRFAAKCASTSAPGMSRPHGPKPARPGPDCGTSIVLGSLALTLNVIPHEIPQDLSVRPVVRRRGTDELVP